MLTPRLEKILDSVMRLLWLPRTRAAIRWAVVAAVLIWMFGPTLVAHVEHASDPLVYNDDVRQQVCPFYRYYDSSLLQNDYLAEYYLACYPWGYHGLYAMAASVGADPAVVSKVVPYVLLLMTLAGLGLSAQRIGGMFAAWAAMALCLAGDLYLRRMTGGLPRSFAFPLLACMLAALTWGRVYVTGALVLVAAAFYPAAAVMGGLALAVLLVLMPAESRGQARFWVLKRRLLFLGATGLLAALVLLPVAVSSSRYGDVIRPTDIAAYPEAGPGGRYIGEDRAPFSGFFEEVPVFSRAALLGVGKPISQKARDWLNETEGRRKPNEKLLWDCLFVLIVFGWAHLFTRHPAAPRVLALGFGAFVGHAVARQVAPFFYLPQRYVIYPVPLITTVMATTAIVGLFGRSFSTGRRRWIRTAAVGAFCLGLVYVVGAEGSDRSGFTVDATRSEKVLKAIGDLPPEALVAGWPMGLMENVPYVTRRAVLVNWESHQAFHTDFVLEMRRRTRALIDAYFATSPAPLVRLRDEFAVTHMLVDIRHLKGNAPKYFRPFHDWTRLAVAAADGKEYEVFRQIKTAAVYQDKHYVLLSLDKLSASSEGGVEQ